ncbi:MAG: ATP-binding protein, partial [Anaerolineales bacterium]|nr:ATP-binding protein [Anaerolineales bacterium]
VAVGVAFGVAGGVAFGMEGGVAGGVTVGVAFGVAIVVMGGVMSGVAVGVAFGVAVGVAFGVMSGVAGGVMSGVAFGVAGGVAVGVAVGVAFGVAGGVMSGVAVGVAGSRLLFYPLLWLQARLWPPEGHPILWDELNPWPLPRSGAWLQDALRNDYATGLQRAAQAAANPFQRGAVQAALTAYLQQHPAPLAQLYALVQEPLLDAYLVMPALERQRRRFPTARVVLLGELGQQPVDGSGGDSETSERLAWRLTRRQRRRVPTPLAFFCGFLYLLERYRDMWATEWFQDNSLLTVVAGASEGVRPLVHGPEVAGAFAALVHFLTLATPGEIAVVAPHLSWIDALSPPLLRPAVVEALQGLGDVSREAAAFAQASSTSHRAAALNRAAGALNELAGFIPAQVHVPEGVLLARVVAGWQAIVAAEQGRLGQTALAAMSPAMRRVAGVPERRAALWQRPAGPLDNPYIAGDPVYLPLLVGRTDIFNRLGEIWAAKANPDSVILYGHRRMGKSSILRNLDQAAPPGSLIVYADMGGETAFVSSTADLLLGLAERIYRAAAGAFPAGGLPEPEPADYDSPARAQFQFNRLTGRVHELLNHQTLFLALDEFEAIERSVKEGKIGADIYQFLRSKSQEPWLTLVFGGLHTLDEMSRDYAQPFYGSYSNIRVSYLSREAAWQLITNPTEDFELDYDGRAVTRIIEETGGQPYLVQQVCRDALDHLNHELFDLQRERPVKILPTDVDAVLDEQFFRRGSVYFDGVWGQATTPAQQALLQRLAQRAAPWSLAEMAAASGQPPEELTELLRWAVRHDILRRSADDPPTWEFCVPLLRRWVQTRQPGPPA